MSDYTFDLAHSFLARCWWQTSPDPIPDQDRTRIRTDLAPVWVEFGSPGRWNRYIRAEPDGEMAKYLAPHSYDAPEHHFCELLWFGAYAPTSGKGEGTFWYEIRPVDRVWMRYNWTLDHNTSTGQLGFWKTDKPAAVRHLKNPSWLWRVPQLKGRVLVAGDRLYNLQLLSARDTYAARARVESISTLSALSLSDQTPQSRMALEVLNIPHGATPRGG